QNRWRLHRPALREPAGGSFPLLDLVGLTGLSLAVEEGLALEGLSDADVDLAVRYALHELNGFPIWFERLLRAHPAPVRAMLKEVVRAEWTSTVEHHGIISRIPFEPEITANVLRELVVTELEGDPPGQLQTVHHAISALLRPNKLDRDLAPLLRTRVM